MGGHTKCIRTPLVVCLILASSLKVSAQGKPLNFIVHGKIVSAESNEPMDHVSVYVPESGKMHYSNAAGEYNIVLPEGRYTLALSAVGYSRLEVMFQLRGDTVLYHFMNPEAVALAEVTVEDSLLNGHGVSLGSNTLDLTTLKKLPALLGEPDLIKSLLLMPGVTTVGEGSSGINVRGSSTDQNLILLDDAPVFNTSHLFGFVTAFNSYSIRRADLYKGGMPAMYGGRVASVLDVKLRRGNASRHSGQAGLGLMTASVNLEGPVGSSKTTYLVSARSSYSDWLLRTIPKNSIKGSEAGFYDITGKVSHQINSFNTLSFTFFDSHDSFKFPGDTVYRWKTRNYSVSLGSTISDKLFLVSSLVSSNYTYSVDGEIPAREFEWSSSVGYLHLKEDLTITFTPHHKANAGMGLENYSINPGSITPLLQSNVNAMSLDRQRGNVYLAYVGDEIDLGKIVLQTGLRLSLFTLLGPTKFNLYKDGWLPSEQTFLGTISKARGPVQRYHAFEPRVSLRYNLNNSSSFKISFDRTAQYLNLVSNTTAVSPVDIWTLSDYYIKPQYGDQYSIGFFKGLGQRWELSSELFYKSLFNVIDYKDGAKVILNNHLETDLRQGEGRSYGLEILASKKKGRFTGWLSYTLSRTERKIAGGFARDWINQGQYYPSNYDKLHNLSFTGNLEKNERVSFGFTFVLSTGKPLTYPTSSFGYGSVRVANFESRNNARSPSYHRLDISMTIHPRAQTPHRWKGSWTVSCYNVYARKNPYSVFFKGNKGLQADAYRLAVIGTIVPSVNYTITF